MASKLGWAAILWYNGCFLVAHTWLHVYLRFKIYPLLDAPPLREILARRFIAGFILASLDALIVFIKV